MLKKDKRINKYMAIENNKYFAVSLNYVFSYSIYYIDLGTLEDDNKKYYFCKNDENQFINSFGIFNSFQDMINSLKSYDITNCNENDIVEVNDNIIIYYGTPVL